MAFYTNLSAQLATQTIRHVTILVQLNSQHKLSMSQNWFSSTRYTNYTCHKTRSTQLAIQIVNIHRKYVDQFPNGYVTNTENQISVHKIE